MLEAYTLHGQLTWISKAPPGWKLGGTETVCVPKQVETLENRTCWVWEGYWEAATVWRRGHSHPLVKSAETALAITGGHTGMPHCPPPLFPSPNFIPPKNTEWFRKSLFNLKSLVDTLPCVKKATRWTWNCKGEILHVIQQRCACGYLKLAQYDCVVSL